MNFVGKERALSGSALKLIAMAAMVIDHIAYMFLYGKPEYGILYEMMRIVGRISYPIFAFLLVEGYSHTRNFGNYMISILMFAFISEIPWLLINQDGSHNVLFTLFAGLWLLYIIEHWKTSITSIILTSIVMSVLLAYFHTDYDWRGLMLILILYLFSDKPALLSGFGILIMSFYGLTGAILAFLILNTYNGSRGFIRGKFSKYLVYLFYPCHLMLLWMISLIL